MTNELFIKLVLGLFSVISVLITAYVVPYIKSQFTQAELDKLSYYISVAVRCAEQLYTPVQWREKKQYVMDYVLRILNESLHLTLDESQLDTIVEGIVNEIKHENDFKKIADQE